MALVAGAGRRCTYTVCTYPFLATPRRQMIENVHTLLAGRLRVSRTADPCVAHVADAVGVAPAPARRRLLLTYLLLRHTPAGFG